MTLLFFGALAMPGMHWEFCWIALDYKRWKLLWRKRIAGTSFPKSCLTTMGSILLPSKNRGSGSASRHLHLSSVKPHGNTINIHPNFQILPTELNCHLISTSSLIWRGLYFGIVFPFLAHLPDDTDTQLPSLHRTDLSFRYRREVSLLFPSSLVHWSLLM